MVSMSPNTQRYNYTYSWENLCEKPSHAYAKFNTNSIYDMIKKDNRFKKTFELIHKGRVTNLSSSNAVNGYTLFVTEDKNIPDNFVKNADVFIAETLINSYTLDGIATKQYLIENGSSVYIPRKYKNENPILAMVKNNDVYINKVGKLLYEINASNGVIHVMSNMAQVSYIN